MLIEFGLINLSRTSFPNSNSFSSISFQKLPSKPKDKNTTCLAGSFSEDSKRGEVGWAVGKREKGHKISLGYNSIAAFTKKRKNRRNLCLGFLSFDYSPLPYPISHCTPNICIWTKTPGLLLRMSSLKWAVKDPLSLKQAIWSSHFIWSALVIYYVQQSGWMGFFSFILLIQPPEQSLLLL